MDLVKRDEFDAVREMASNARLENEALKQQIEALEKQVASLKKTVKPAPKAPRPKKAT